VGAGSLPERHAVRMSCPQGDLPGDLCATDCQGCWRAAGRALAPPAGWTGVHYALLCFTEIVHAEGDALRSLVSEEGGRLNGHKSC